MTSEESPNVYFVGAGPGDPGLLTVRALKLIQSADVVIYDSLVTEDIINLINVQAKKIPMRRNPKERGLSIEEVGKIMADYSNLGKRVVRLKCGDPLIFGRTGEEIDQLIIYGVDWVIIPGISSALSSPALSKTVLTDRRNSSSLAIVTGHESKNKKTSAVRWEKLADAVDTIIVLMGSSNIPDYCEKLISAGMDQRSTVTMVYNVSRSDQEITRTTLGRACIPQKDTSGDLCTVIISKYSSNDCEKDKIKEDKFASEEFTASQKNLLEAK